ncbi:trigger factor [Nocardioides alkalitolerans]|uniref:trigger factor n=1 Tax=Nocardioides alkalitolerans TaxID=281714 RepID=UPI0004102421|nr:trigger factor [Nocardioides alkalitolerans]
MKSAVESLSPTRAKLTVEVPFEELKPSLDKAYKTIAQQINIPGFRRGKVPPAVIDRQVGRGAVLDQAINEALPKAYSEALNENGLEPLTQPEIEVTRLEDRELVEFTAEMDVKPEIELPDYEGLEAEVEDFAVTDEDVDTQVEALRERFGTLIDVERAAADGDFVTIDLVATKDGEVVPGAEVSDMSYKVGRGGMLDGLDEAIEGLSAGESKDFTSELVGGDLVGENVDVTVKVSAVQEQELPELDDEFAQMASEFDTVDELVADVRARLERGKRLEQAAAARDAVLEVLLEKVSIPLPETMVTETLNSQRANIEQQLGMANLTMDKYLEDEGKTIEEFEADMERNVRDAVAAQFVLDEIAKKEELGVEQADLSQHIVRRAQQSGQDPQEFANHMFEHNHIPELISEILRGKALATLVESAVVKDASGNVVELKNLRPDGTIGEPEDEAAEGDDDAAVEAAADDTADATDADATAANEAPAADEAEGAEKS